MLADVVDVPSRTLIVAQPSDVPRQSGLETTGAVGSADVSVPTRGKIKDAFTPNFHSRRLIDAKQKYVNTAGRSEALKVWWMVLLEHVFC